MSQAEWLFKLCDPEGTGFISRTSFNDIVERMKLSNAQAGVEFPIPSDKEVFFQHIQRNGQMFTCHACAKISLMYDTYLHGFLQIDECLNACEADLKVNALRSTNTLST